MELKPRSESKRPNGWMFQVVVELTGGQALGRRKMQNCVIAHRPIRELSLDVLQTTQLFELLWRNTKISPPPLFLLYYRAQWSQRYLCTQKHVCLVGPTWWIAGPDSLYSHSWFLYPRASPVPLNSMAALYCSTVAVFLQHEHLNYFSLHISRVINQQIRSVKWLLWAADGPNSKCVSLFIKLISTWLLLLSLLL